MELGIFKSFPLIPSKVWILIFILSDREEVAKIWEKYEKDDAEELLGTTAASIQLKPINVQPINHFKYKPIVVKGVTETEEEISAYAISEKNAYEKAFAEVLNAASNEQEEESMETDTE